MVKMSNNAVHPVIHYNKIGHEINESVINYPNSDRTVYCRLRHSILPPELRRCMNCPLFFDSMGAYGVACKWDDVIPQSNVLVKHEDRQKELLRVSQLINAGILPKIFNGGESK